MTQIKNILFVMYDQLRHDYLSCAGHPTRKTPNFDRLAARGVNRGAAILLLYTAMFLFLVTLAGYLVPTLAE